MSTAAIRLNMHCHYSGVIIEQRKQGVDRHHRPMLEHKFLTVMGVARGGSCEY